MRRAVRRPPFGPADRGWANACRSGICSPGCSRRHCATTSFPTWARQTPRGKRRDGSAVRTVVAPDVVIIVLTCGGRPGSGQRPLPNLSTRRQRPAVHRAAEQKARALPNSGQQDLRPAPTQAPTAAIGCTGRQHETAGARMLRRFMMPLLHDQSPSSELISDAAPARVRAGHPHPKVPFIWLRQKGRP
jgi:hypothetical protein